MCIQLKSNQILNHRYIALGITQGRREVLLTAVCKTIFLISLALIEIEEVSLCHSINLPKRNLKNAKVLASFELSHLGSLVLLTSGHKNGNFLFSSGKDLLPCISSSLKNVPRVFPERESSNLLLLLGCCSVFSCCTFIPSPRKNWESSVLSCGV